MILEHLSYQFYRLVLLRFRRLQDLERYDVAGFICDYLEYHTRLY